MELSPEEYGAYWGASLRISAGVLVVFFGHRFLAPFIDHPEVGATALGVTIFGLLVVVGCFLAAIGVARIVRTAMGAQR